MGNKSICIDMLEATLPEIGLNGVYHRVQPSISKCSGTAKEMVVLSNISGNVKFNFYEGSQVTPGNLISASDLSLPVLPGVNILPITEPFKVRDNNTYWLGIVGDVDQSNVRDSSTNTRIYYKTVTYSSFQAPVDLSGYANTVGAKVLLGVIVLSASDYFISYNGRINKGNGCIGNGSVRSDTFFKFIFKQYNSKSIISTICGWTSEEVDGFLIGCVNAGVSSCNIDLSGNNGPRTSKSDSAYLGLIALGNTIATN